jgi:hypothetical protein
MRCPLGSQRIKEPCGTATCGTPGVCRDGRVLLGCVGWPVHSTGQGRVLGAWASSSGPSAPLRAGFVCGRISAPALRGTGGPVAGAPIFIGATRDGPVRAIRRPPPRLRPASGGLRGAARRPRSDGAIPCLCVGSMHDVDATAFEARPRGACAGLRWCAFKRTSAAHVPLYSGSKGRDGANGRRRPGARKQGAPNP